MTSPVAVAPVQSIADWRRGGVTMPQSLHGTVTVALLCSLQLVTIKSTTIYRNDILIESRDKQSPAAVVTAAAREVD